jgi:hypothetical protein
MQEQMAKVEELAKQVDEKNEAIAALQKQVQACMAIMRGGRAIVHPLEAPGSPLQNNNENALVVIPQRQGQEPGSGGEASTLAVVEELKKTFKADAADMRADFEKHIARLREVCRSQ